MIVWGWGGGAWAEISSSKILVLGHARSNFSPQGMVFLDILWSSFLYVYVDVQTQTVLILNKLDKSSKSSTSLTRKNLPL